MTICFQSISTPLGPLTAQWNGDGLQSLVYQQADAGAASTHATVKANRVDAFEEPFQESLCRALLDFFDGKPPRATPHLEPMGTAFQREVWQALIEIPWGDRVSYQEIANRIGRPKASRAVGAAIGKNPIALLIPCHRVVASSGALTGFAWGVERKRYLLELETNQKQLSLTS